MYFFLENNSIFTFIFSFRIFAPPSDILIPVARLGISSLTNNAAISLEKTRNSIASSKVENPDE